MKIKNLFRRILTIVILLLIFVIVMKLTETERTESVLENLKIERILTPYNFEDCNNTKRIKYIVVHYFGDLATAEEVANYYYSYSVDVSAHYCLDGGNVVYQCVEDGDISWHCGDSGIGDYKDKCSNSNSIGVEVRPNKLNADRSAFPDDNDWYFDEAATANLIEFVQYLMDKYNVPIENVIRHYDVTGKLCPRPWVGDDINTYYGKTGNEMWEEFKSELR